MIKALKAIIRSFGYAFRGIARTVAEERNFRVHVVAVCLVTWFAFLYEVTVGQAIVLIILFGMVMSLELVNTAVENAVDLATDKIHPLAKKAKDAASGGVLVGAITSVVVAVLMFRDSSHWALVAEKLKHPIAISSVIVFVVLALFFVRGKARK